MLKTRSINLQGSELPNYLAFEIIYMYCICIVEIQYACMNISQLHSQRVILTT